MAISNRQLLLYLKRFAPIIKHSIANPDAIYFIDIKHIEPNSFATLFRETIGAMRGVRDFWHESPSIDEIAEWWINYKVSIKRDAQYPVSITPNRGALNLYVVTYEHIYGVKAITKLEGSHTLPISLTAIKAIPVKEDALPYEEDVFLAVALLKQRKIITQAVHFHSCPEILPDLRPYFEIGVLREEPNCIYLI